MGSTNRHLTNSLHEDVERFRSNKNVKNVFPRRLGFLLQLSKVSSPYHFMERLELLHQKRFKIRG